MRPKLPLPLTLATLFICAAFSVFAQTPPAAKGPRAFSPLAVGFGLSGYNTEAYRPGHILGETLWVDYYPDRVPSLLRGIGIEAEFRDLSFARSNPANRALRSDTGEGGLIYSYPRFRDIRPYGKAMLGFGNLDQTLTGSPRHHDTRNLEILGGGVDVRVFHSIWLRGDYEYQWWPDMKFAYVNKVYKPIAAIHAQGISAGVVYHF